MPAPSSQTRDASPGASADSWADPAWAWAPYTPNQDHPWTLPWAGHLYRRAAFGARWDELSQALDQGPQHTVDALFHPKPDGADFNRTHDAYEASAAESVEKLRAWWLRRMIDTPHPLLEMMTLFWHDYFAVSNARVQNPLLVRRHVQQLRGQALGDFAALLETVLGDPALFLNLDAPANRKTRPNAFFARTLLERLTLGPDRFSEEDVQAAARAFTGWFVVRNDLRFVPREHDPGTKQFLGENGPLTNQDVLRILLRQPATSRHVVSKLYRWFISETDPPPETLIAPLAAAFAKDYDVCTLVKTMLGSNLFFSKIAYRQKIKGPVAFAVGLVRALEGRVGTTRLGADLAALGQDLYQPPTVDGWAGHHYWINRFTLLERSRIAEALLTGSDAYGSKLDLPKLIGQHGPAAVPTAVPFLLDLLLQGDVTEETRKALVKTISESAQQTEETFPEQIRRAAALAVSLPEFHVA